MDAVSRYKAVGIFILIALVVASVEGQGFLESNASPKLIVGTKHIPPFAIKNPDGSWSGISVELWRQITTDLNREYELRELTLQGLLEGLRTGSINAAVAALTITTEVGAGGKDRIAVVLRSMMACLFYVSQSVEAPAEDEKAGRVTVSCDDQGNRFDWCEVTGGLMQIHSSKQEPENAYVAVRYRGNWFYISDSDLTSKSTFSLLMQLFDLQAGEIKSTGPILTLPVGR